MQLTDPFERLEDDSAIRWIADELRTPVGVSPKGDHLRTLDLLPRHFAAYAKVLHPVFELPPDDHASTIGEPERDSLWSIPTTPRVRWTEVARRIGVPFDKELPATVDREWPDDSVSNEGSLSPAIVGRLARALACSTTEEVTCWWWAVAAMAFLPSSEVVEHGLRDALCRVQIFTLAEFLRCHDVPSPSYWWPTDRAWCVCTDWDLHFTVVGGFAVAIDQLLADPEIEGFRVGADDVVLRYSHPDRKGGPPCRGTHFRSTAGLRRRSGRRILPTDNLSWASLTGRRGRFACAA